MFKALLTIRGIQFAPDGGYRCTFPAWTGDFNAACLTGQISASGSRETRSRPAPGIAKKLAAGGTPPPGIAKRFPAATVTPTLDTTETETGGAASAADASSPDNTTSSVDLLV